MLIYIILVTALLLVCTFSMHRVLRQLLRIQQFQTQWLQDLPAGCPNPLPYRRMFRPGGHAPKVLNPVMAAPYQTVMTEPQSRRYRQWC